MTQSTNNAGLEEHVDCRPRQSVVYDKAKCVQAYGGDVKETHRVPVAGNLLQTKHLTDVDQVEDVFLEAAATKAHRR